tara:strand:+ start:175 stop:387 length:213 start_codon:yes stop_codon:yes gene_type:complete
MLEGWFETDSGMEPFIIEEATSFVEAVKEMVAYDPENFGFTDMEIEWNGEDVTKLVYDTVEGIHNREEDV